MLGKLYRWYGKKTVWTVVFVIVALAILAFFKLGGGDEQAVESVDLTRSVNVAPAGNLSAGAAFSFIGTVEAVSEAPIATERAGRVTSVTATLGQPVDAGTTLLTLENAAERAALTQAQGAYEAAKAGAAQSDVSVSEAEAGVQAANNSLVSVLRGAYTSAQSALSTIDTYYSNPQSGIIGLRVSGSSYTNTLNQSRTNLRTTIPAWNSALNSINEVNPSPSIIQTSKEEINHLITLTDTFILVFSDNNLNDYTDTERSTNRNAFVSLRSSLVSALSAINAAETGLDSAKKTLERVKLSGSTGEVSVADAQVKQALGSLQAAQANYSKTIVRASISGTVNELDVKVGDFVSAFSPLGQVVNNGSYEVVMFVSEKDRTSLSVGDEVQIDGMNSGTITKIGGGINSITQKTEVRIATTEEDLSNGDTVTVTLNGSERKSVPETLFIPLTAVKFTADAGSVFIVKDNVLVQVEISIGQIRADQIEVTSGISPETIIVTDARGLSAGTKVSISN